MNLKPSLGALAGVLVLSACSGPLPGEDLAVERSALSTSFFQWMGVPAYYDNGPGGNYDWMMLGAYQGEYGSAVEVAIVNAGCEASGLGAACGTGGPFNSAAKGLDTNLQSRITTLHNTENAYWTIGYVDFGRGRNPNDVAADIAAWVNYGVNGIFFDRMGNTRPSNSTNPAITSAQIDSFTAHGKWAIEQVMAQPSFRVQGAMFNFGYTGQWMERFVNCTQGYQTPYGNYYVTFEAPMATYDTIPANAISTDPSYQWLSKYTFAHFVHLVYAMDGVTHVSSVMTKAAQLNAMTVYVTDQGSANPWGHIASYPVWTAAANVVWNEAMNAPVTFPSGLHYQDPPADPSCPASSASEL